MKKIFEMIPRLACCHREFSMVEIREVEDEEVSSVLSELSGGQPVYVCGGVDSPATFREDEAGHADAWVDAMYGWFDAPTKEPRYVAVNPA